MGLFDKAIKYVAGDPQKEALKILQESLAALGGMGLGPEAKRGAIIALTEVMAALKRRKLTTPEIEEEAGRLVDLFSPTEGARP